MTHAFGMSIPMTKTIIMSPTDRVHCCCVGADHDCRAWLWRPEVQPRNHEEGQGPATEVPRSSDRGKFSIYL